MNRSGETHNKCLITHWKCRGNMLKMMLKRCLKSYNDWSIWGPYFCNGHVQVHVVILGRFPCLDLGADKADCGHSTGLGFCKLRRNGHAQESRLSMRK